MDFLNASRSSEAPLIVPAPSRPAVPFKEAPKYNPRRRSGLVLPRTHSESRLSSPLSKPPSPSPSNRSLPPFSSASSLSEASTGSSGTCTQPTSETEPPLLHGTGRGGVPAWDGMGWESDSLEWDDLT